MQALTRRQRILLELLLTGEPFDVDDLRARLVALTDTSVGTFDVLQDADRLRADGHAVRWDLTIQLTPETRR